MTRGVLYYNRNTSCIIRIITSIHSLRKHYDGPVAIASSGEDSHVWIDKLKDCELNVDVVHIDLPVEEGKNYHFLETCRADEYTPFDITIWMDADTIIRGDITELFDLAEKYEFVTTNFANWGSAGKGISRRIRGWEDIYPQYMEDAINFGPAVNCGIIAWKSGAKFMQDWYEKTVPGRHNFIPNETCMQVIIPQYRHYVADQKFNCSCKYSNPKDPDTRVIHYHGRKHCRPGLPFNGDIWVEEYKEALIKNYAGFSEWGTLNDKMLNRYYNWLAEQEPVDFTIVTGVTPNYLEKFKLTMPTWKLKPQFAEKELVVFAHGFDNIHDLDFVLDWGKVKIVPWDLEGSDSLRETMLSAFVMGAPNEVTTTHWVKIDCDSYFTTDEDLFDRGMFNYDIAGHKWRYTKPGSWLVELDDWAESKVPGMRYLQSDEEIESAKAQKRYGHRRVASWVMLHRVDFCKEVLEYIDDRLPVPSHDTFMWYMADRLPKRKWCWKNWKGLGAGTHTNIKVIREAIENSKLEAAT